MKYWNLAFNAQGSRLGYLYRYIYIHQYIVQLVVSFFFFFFFFPQNGKTLGFSGYLVAKFFQNKILKIFLIIY
jgi:hypothetical protein